MQGQSRLCADGQQSAVGMVRWHAVYTPASKLKTTHLLMNMRMLISSSIPMATPSATPIPITTSIPEKKKIKYRIIACNGENC